MATTPISSLDFLSTLGVNIHLEQRTADYGDLSAVIADLNYLGINQVRDDYSQGVLPVSSYVTLANAGVHFDFISAVSGSITTASLANIVSSLATIDAAHPGSVIAVEGPNEINNFPLTFNGVGGTAGAVAFQRALYSDVHSNANLAGAAVYYFTGYGYGGEAVGPNPATTPGLADFDNQHPYPTGGTPSEWANPANQFSFFNESSPGPGVYTEFSYSQDTNSGLSQAQGTIDFLLDAAGYGVAKTFIYELMEEGDRYGLFNGTTPTPIATAIHNLTTILADTGRGGVAPTAINDTISGLGSSGHSLLIEKSTGVFDLALWNEGSGSANVNVGLGATYASASVEDIITGATTNYSNVNSVSVSLGQDPMMVQFSSSSGGPPPPPPPPPPTESPNDAVVLAGSAAAITDSHGNLWTITPGATIDENGSPVSFTYQVVELAYVNHTVYQENSVGNWYDWTGTAWAATTEPAGIVGVPPIHHHH